MISGVLAKKIDEAKRRLRNVKDPLFNPDFVIGIIDDLVHMLKEKDGEKNDRAGTQVG